MFWFILSLVGFVILVFILLVISIRKDNAKQDEKLIKEAIEESEKYKLFSQVEEINKLVKNK